MKRKEMSEGSILVLEKHIKRIKFYRKLSQFGYILKLKPVKIFRDEDGNTTKKANCDVDMTFDLMRLKDEYRGVLVLSGDGDFAVVLKYLKETGKKVTILARSERTAREIKQMVGEDFRDFNRLRTTLEFFDKK
ncbi:MAG: NYN domain-containing protein [Patescibacteria group bacterium]|nr:NYN domain-containing protein [Patescibacteria group bacterium]